MALYWLTICFITADFTSQPLPNASFPTINPIPRFGPAKQDQRFATNANRVRNRAALYQVLPGLTAKKPAQVWLDGLTERGVPCGPVNTLDQVFADPQVLHRQMRVAVPYPGAQGGEIELIGNPIKYSKTPVAYDRPPPRLGEHTEEVLEELLDMEAAEIAALRQSGAI